MNETTQVHKDLWHDYMRLLDFAKSLLDPERLGHQASDEIREEAKKAIGITKGVE